MSKKVMSNQKDFILFDILNRNKDNDDESFEMVEQDLKKNFKSVFLNRKKSQVLVRLNDGVGKKKIYIYISQYQI